MSHMDPGPEYANEPSNQAAIDAQWALNYGDDVKRLETLKASFSDLCKQYSEIVCDNDVATTAFKETLEGMEAMSFDIDWAIEELEARGQ